VTQTQELEPVEPAARRRSTIVDGLDALVDDARVRRLFTYGTLVLLFYFVEQLLWPAPIGVLVQGLVIGGLTSLIAFGIALIYRANRIINFAQGDLGAVPATLAVLLIVGPGLPYLVALPIGIGAAIVLGAVVEFIFIRRFFKAPRLVLTVVTIGLSLLLAGSGILLPRAFDIQTPPQSFPSPFDFHFAIGQTIFRGNDIVAMLAVPAVILALVAFFRFTNIGIAVRASAENADRAFLLGVPVKRIQTVVWVVASVLATLSIFLRAGIVGLPLGRVLGPSILLRALAAATIARMERLPTIFGAAVILGMLESAVIFHTGRGILVDPILFAVILGALILQRRGEAARTEEQSSWQTAAEVRGIPRELSRIPEVIWSRRGVYAVLAALALSLPFLMSESQINLAAAIVIVAIVGISLVVLTGWAGQVSLGQVAFMGIGGAVGGYVTTAWHWDLSIALIVGGLVGAVAATVIGLPALRIRGLFLAVTTLSLALATSSYLLNREFVHWLPVERFERPMLLGRISVATETRYYYFTLGCLVLVIFAARGLRRSRTGRVLIGIRENERAAQAYGVSAVGAKLTAFAVSGFIAAFAGVVFVHHQQVLGIEPYGIERSFQVFITTVVGGIGSVPGAILGAVFIEGFQYFRNVFPQALQNLLGFITGPVGVILVLMIVPGGLAQALYMLRDALLRRVAARRGILVPSLVADRRVMEELEVQIQARVQTAQTMPADGDGRGPSRGVRRRPRRSPVARPVAAAKSTAPDPGGKTP
jgi:branched-chain amino acid transport system permease protein